jgi:hypothetical protein
LTDDECTLIKTCCLEAVKAKWADKAKIKKENAQPHLENAFKQEAPVEEQLLASVDEVFVEESFQIDTTLAGQAKMKKVLDQIGQKRARPATGIDSPTNVAPMRK